MKPRTKEEAVQIDQLPWKPFPDAFSKGGIRWKLLHVSPEAGAWTAIFDCPAGSSFAAHIHNGPGEYLLTPFQVRSATVQHRRHGGVNGRGKGQGQGL